MWSPEACHRNMTVTMGIAVHQLPAEEKHFYSHTSVYRYWLQWTHTLSSRIKVILSPCTHCWVASKIKCAFYGWWTFLKKMTQGVIFEFLPCFNPSTLVKLDTSSIKSWLQDFFFFSHSCAFSKPAVQISVVRKQIHKTSFSQMQSI